MNNLLTILFAILDCKVWNIDQITDWTDQIIPKLDNPKAWLLELSTSNSVDSSLEIILEAMKESSVSLPDNIGNLMAGFILLQFDKGVLSAELAKSYLIDIVDAYGANSIDAEAAATVDLNSKVYSEIRQHAKQVLQYLTSKQLLETEQKLITD